MKTALKRLMQSLRMKLWKPKEGKRLAQSHKIVTLLAQALFTKTILGENTRALLSSDGKDATECCGPVRDFEEGRNEVEEGGCRSCLLHICTLSHTHTSTFSVVPVPAFNALWRSCPGVLAAALLSDCFIPPFPPRAQLLSFCALPRRREQQ